MTGCYLEFRRSAPLRAPLVLLGRHGLVEKWQSLGDPQQLMRTFKLLLGDHLVKMGGCKNP